MIDGGEFIKLNSEQIAKSVDFDIIYNIIGQICHLRSLDGISLKKPIKQVSLIWDVEFESRYSPRFKEYLDSMVVDECNLLDIKILSKYDVNIKKTIVPVKALFFKEYGKDIGTSFEQINKMNLKELEKIISDGEFNGYKIRTEFFNYSYGVELPSSQTDSKDL